MVNAKIVNWLKDNKAKGYSLLALRQKLIDLKFDKQDIDDAIKSLDFPGEKISFGDGDGIKKKGHLIKIAGIIGLLGLIILVVSQIMSFVLPTQDYVSGMDVASVQEVSPIIGIVLLIVFIVLIITYLAGFMKIGRVCEVKLLKISALMKILFIPLALIIATVAGLLAWLGGNYLLSGVLGGVLVLYYFVVGIVFSIGLIKAGPKVKFAKIAGIFNLLLIVMMLVVIGFWVYMLTNISLLASMFLTGSISTSLIALNIANVVLIDLALLFEVLTLFNASKVFE